MIEPTNDTEKADDTVVSRLVDPTTASFEAGNAERDRRRAEVLRLSKALVVAYTDAQAVSAERDCFQLEAERIRKIGDTMFVEGYEQAVRDIRNHFLKAQQSDIAVTIESIWTNELVEESATTEGAGE